MHYRAEIDGLRAVAVLPVILFHAGMPGFGGGFVGVDVFFVISGYLITTILVADLDSGTLSIARFYERRARRILPALFLVLAACIPFALVWLPPMRFRDFAEAVGTVAVFLSNVLFLTKSDYFAPAAEENPLLHTWSLAVEEQFYLLYPLVLALLWRRGPRMAAAGLAVLGVASLGFALWLLRDEPTAAFFLLPTRAWQLMAGALCALWLHRRAAGAAAPAGGRAPAWPAAAGLAAIVAAVVLFDRQTPFPGLPALLPVAGTAAVILWAAPGTAAARLLSARPLVAVGLVSYPAYLWHQPLFAFARIRGHAEPPAWAMLALAGVALVLAWATWALVERPFRRAERPWLPARRMLFAAALAGIAGFFAFGLWGHLTEGREARWLAQADPARRATHVAIRTAEAVTRRSDDGGCVFNVEALTDAVADRMRACRDRHGPGVLVIGDSHAIDLAEALAAQRRVPFLAGLTAGGCRPDGSRARCPHEAVPGLVAASPGLFSHAVLEVAGQHLVSGPRGLRGNGLFGLFAPESAIPEGRITVDAVRIDRIATWAEALARLLPVVWLGPRPEPHLPMSWVLERGCDHPYALRPGQAVLFAAIDAAIARRVGGGPVVHVAQAPLLDLRFPQDFLTCAGGLMWSDTDHLSGAGRLRFGARLVPLLNPPG